MANEITYLPRPLARLLLALLLALGGGLGSIYAQVDSYIVRGSVLDEDGEPLAGVTIMAKSNHRIACFSDGDGHFELHIPHAEEMVLQVSYVGMIPTEVTVSPKKNAVTVYLYPNVELLGEVVVTGYQTLSKERATGSFSVIEPKVLEEKLDVNILDRLEGQVAGLNSSSGELTLRGISTLRGNTRPLIVLNGMPYEGNVSAINPSTVQNITVLKDAAAASIYGARAANGVIVITTKQGAKDSKVHFTYDGSVRFSTKPRMSALNLMSSKEAVDYYLYVQEKFPLEEIPEDTYQYYISPLSLATMKYRHGLIPEADFRKTVDYYSSLDNRQQLADFYLRTGLEHQHNFALSGGSDMHQYMLTANYVGERPTNKFANSRRYGFTIEDQVSLTDRITIDAGLTGSYTDSYADIGVGDYMGMYRGNPSFYMLYDEKGEPLPIPGRRSESELARIRKAGLYDLHYYPTLNQGLETMNDHSSFYRINTGLTAKLLEGLNLSLRYSGDFGHSKRETLQDPKSHGARSMVVNAASLDPETGELMLNIPRGGIMKQERGDSQAFTLRGQLNYTLNRGDHYLTALAGSEIRSIKETLTSGKYFGYDPNTLGFVPVDFNKLAEIYGAFAVGGLFGYNYLDDNYLYEHEDRYVSFYSNASYSYQGKYDVTGSIRVDQSNLFGTDPRNQYRPLWSLGGMWHMTEESFMEPASDWLSNLVLRLTYGIGGNVPKDAGPFLTLSAPTYNPTNQAQVSIINNPPNPNLRWEKTATTNLGIDFDILNGKLWGTIDLYNRHTTDLMAQRTADPTLGWDKLTLNYGVMDNRGLELTLGSTLHFGEVTYTPSLVFSVNHNKLVNVEESNPNTFSYTQGTATTVGYPYNSVFSFPSAGLSPENGTPLYYHTNPETGKREVTDNVYDVTMEDLVYQGNKIPTRNGSFTNRIEWKGLSVSLMLYYSGGNVLRAVVAPYTGGMGGSNMPREYLNFWKQPGDEKDLTTSPAITGQRVMDQLEHQGWSAADIHAFPGDYLKIRDLTISYELPHEYISILGLRSMDLMLQLQNLGTISFNKRGYDAESTPLGAAGYGWGDRVVPSPMTISLGTTINL